MTVEQVLQLLDSARRSEQEFVEEFLRRRELLRAAQAQIRLGALEAFREAILARLSLENSRESGES